MDENKWLHIEQMLSAGDTPANEDLQFLYDHTKSLARGKNFPFNSIKQQLRALTPFLPETSLDKTRLWHLLTNTQKVPTCAMCTTPVKWDPAKHKYREYCSSKCMGQSDCFVNKIKQTNLRKYGVVAPSKHPTISTKIKQSLRNKTRDEWEKITNKRKTAWTDKLGVDNPSKSCDVKEVKKTTSHLKYGTDYPTQSPEVKDKVRSTWQQKNPEQLRDILKSRIEYFQQNFSVNNPSQLESVKEAKRTTLMSNHGVVNPNYIGRNMEVFAMLMNKHWLHDQHITKQNTFTQIAANLGVADSTVGTYAKLHNIQPQTFSVSTGERELREFFEELHVKFTPNDRTVLKPKELDIYLPDHKLAIEYCGLYWHSEQLGKNKYYHYNKWNECQQQGIRLLTIFEDEWLTHKEIIKQKIKVLLQRDDRSVVYARQCSVVHVDSKTKQHFFNTHHIQGDGPGSVNIGLKHNNELVACVSLISQRRGKYVLNRYATKHRVPGGFSRLLKHFQQTHEWNEIVSFADLRWSDGGLYNTTEWELDSILPPDYYYSPNGRVRYHKSRYRRKYLPHMLAVFDPTLSEKQNCDINGILRLWDCGKLRFLLKNYQ